MPTSLRVKWYRFCYTCHRFVEGTGLIALAAIAGVALGIAISWFRGRAYTAWPLPHSAFPARSVTLWLGTVSLWAAWVFLLVFLCCVAFAAWFNLWFRRLAWGTARTVGKAMPWLVSGWRGTVWLFAGVILLMWGRARLAGVPLHAAQVLSADFALKAVAASVLLVVLFQAYRMRERIVILPFNNVTGDERLKAQVDGLAGRLLSDLARLRQLYAVIDEARPSAAQGEKGISVTVNVQDSAEALQGAVSADSKVKFGFVEIPVGAIAGLTARILQGPRLSGSLQRNGDKLLLIAQIGGGGRKGNWRVTIDDVEEPGTGNEPEALARMVEQMAYRVFTDLVDVGSRRWQAVRCYSHGLRLYRDSKETSRDHRLNLRRAERSFIEALSVDSRFAPNHYNLGIVYRDLEQADSARSAFTRAVGQGPRLIDAHYALALNYWNAGSFADAIGFCNRVIALQPDDARAWNLKGLSERKLMEQKLAERKQNRTLNADEWRESLESREIAAALAWRALCRATLARRPLDGPMDFARSCTRGSAIAHGSLGHKRSKAVFRQALSLGPADQDIGFELGKTLIGFAEYRRGIEALSTAARIDGKPAYWAELADACAGQFERTKDDAEKEQYRNAARDASSRALEDLSAAGKEIAEKIQSVYRRIGDSGPADNLDWFGKDNPLSIMKQWPWGRADLAVRLASSYLDTAASTEDDAVRMPKARKAGKHLERALVDLKAEHSREIRSRGLYVLLARAYRFQKRMEEALQNAHQAVQQDPASVPARQELGQVYYAMFDYARAETEYQISLDLNPEDAETARLIAFCNWDRGVYMRDPSHRKEAFGLVIDMLHRTLELVEEVSFRAWACHWLGQFYLELKNYDQAVSFLRIAQASGYSPLESRVDLAWIYVEIRAHDEAEQILREAAAEAWKLRRTIKPSMRASAPVAAQQGPETLNSLLVGVYLCWAFSWAERGVNTKRAMRLTRYAARRIALVKDASKRLPLTCAYHDCLGWVQFRAGQTRDAIAELEKALAIGATGVVTYGGVYYRLASACLARAREDHRERGRWLARTRECCAIARVADLRGVYLTAVESLLAQADALTGRG